MADEKINIVVSLKDNASKAIKGVNDAFTKLGTTAKLVAAAGIATISKVLYDCVKAFGQSETATKGLESALRSTGQEVKGNLKQLTDFATKMQNITTIEDDVVVGLLKTATAMGLTADQSELATQNAIGLSEAFGVDLDSALKMATAAQAGNYTMMTRAIPALRGIKDESELAAKAQELMAAGFKQAQDKTKTFEGSMLQLKNSVNSAQETIGSVFAPVISKVAGVIKEVVDWFNKLDPALQKNVVIIGTISAVVIALIPVLGVLAAAVAAISWPVLAVVAAVAALTAGFLIMRNEIQAVGGVGNLIKNIYLSWFQMMLEGFQQILIAAKKFIDLLNKIPGVKIPIDDAIANIDKLQEKLEEKKAKRIETETAEEDESRELALAKGEERNAALMEQKQAQDEARKAYDEEMKAANIEKQIADREAEIAQKEAWFQADLAKLGSDEAAKAQLTAQYNRVRATDSQKLVELQNKQKEQQSKDFTNWENFMLGATKSKNKEVAAIAKALAIKNIVFQTGQAAMSAYSAMAAIPFVGPVLGAAAAAAAIAFGAEQIQTVQSQGTELAEGGIVMPTPGGTQATIGEAGSAEAVIPLDDPEAKSMLGGAGGGNQNITVNISGKPLAKEMYEIQQEMIRTGELSA